MFNAGILTGVFYFDKESTHNKNWLFQALFLAIPKRWKLETSLKNPDSVYFSSCNNYLRISVHEPQAQCRSFTELTTYQQIPLTLVGFLHTFQFEAIPRNLYLPKYTHKPGEYASVGKLSLVISPGHYHRRHFLPLNNPCSFPRPVAVELFPKRNPKERGGP